MKNKENKCENKNLYRINIICPMFIHNEANCYRNTYEEVNEQYEKYKKFVIKYSGSISLDKLSSIGIWVTQKNYIKSLVEENS